MNGSLQNQQFFEHKQAKMKGVVIMDVDANETSFPYSGDEGDIMDSGAVDHSSDSDYEPPIGAVAINNSEKIIAGKCYIFHQYS